MIDKPFKPMLAGTVTDFTKLRFPLLASPKLDGIRCIICDGVAVSRKLLPIPNRFVQAQLKGLPDGFDGELMVGIPGNFNDVQSAVMSVEGEPDFTFEIFDLFHIFSPAHHYKGRMDNAFATVRADAKKPGFKRAHILEQTVIVDMTRLEAFEEKCVSVGFEGVMLRDPNGPYKFGRSTEREGYLLKWKRSVDEEATIIGYEEMMHNDNEAGKDELGRTKRSSAKAGKRPAGTLGSLRVRRPDGVEFSIGTFEVDMAERARLWSKRDGLIGQQAKYKYFPAHVDENGAPTSAVFLGIRHPNDL